MNRLDDWRVNLTLEKEWLLALQMLDLFTRSFSTFRWVIITLRGWLLTEWSKITDQPTLRDARSKAGLLDWASIAKADEIPIAIKIRAYFDQGSYRLSRKHYSEAIAEFDDVIRLQQPHDLGLRNQSLLHRGYAHCEMGALELGIEDYSTVISDRVVPDYLLGPALLLRREHSLIRADIPNKLPIVGASLRWTTWNPSSRHGQVGNLDGLHICARTSWTQKGCFSSL